MVFILYGGERVKQIHIRVDNDLYKDLADCADIMNQTVPAFVREAVACYIRDLKRNKREGATGVFTFSDLFAGIGGMRLALENVGGQCLFASEEERYSRQTYFVNFGERPAGDITKLDAASIPDHDILTASFPCQSFPKAGRSESNGPGREQGFEARTQGTQFFDICRILQDKRPKAFLLESTKTLRSHEGGRTFKIILKSLLELEYDVFYKVLNGRNYVPQHRERIIMVGFDKKRYGEYVDFDFLATAKSSKPVMADILEQDVSYKYTLSDKLWTYLQTYAAKQRAEGHGTGYGIAEPQGIARTLTAGYYKDGAEILISQQERNPRRLTPRECARLQGFPDSFKITVSDSQAYKQFGSSVVVPMIEDVARLMVQKLAEMEGTELGEDFAKADKQPKQTKLQFTI